MTFFKLYKLGDIRTKYLPYNVRWGRWESVIMFSMAQKDVFLKLCEKSLNLVTIDLFPNIFDARGRAQLEYTDKVDPSK